MLGVANTGRLEYESELHKEFGVALIGLQKIKLCELHKEFGVALKGQQNRM